MNKLIPKIGALIVAVTVFLFAVCLIFGFNFGSYLVCMLLPIGYIMMAAGFHHECREEQRVSANIGLVFSAIYAVLIFLVYFAQTTQNKVASHLQNSAAVSALAWPLRFEMIPTER